MADNVELNAGTGGVTLATDDVGGIHYQLVKLSYGALDSATIVSTTNGLPVAQQGTWNVNNVSGTVSLPTGAATAAKQPALGTAGTASTDVITVQGIASMTALKVDGSGVTQPVSGTVTVTDGSGSLTVDGTVTANLAAGTNNIGDVDVLTVPADPFGANADAASATGSISAKLRFIASTGIPITGTVTVGSHAVTNAGTFVTQENGAALTSLQLLDDCIIADDATFTPATTKVTMCGFTADEASTDSVDEGDGGAARMTLDRKLIATTYAHAAAGGATPYYNLDCDETEDAIKATAGKLFWIHVMNLSASVRYIKFYNATVANVTVGTTTPVLSFPVPTMADTNGAGFCVNFGDMGLQFDTAITVAATTGLADNSTGAPGANEVVLNAGFL